MTALNYDHIADDYARHRRAYPGLVEHIVDYAGVGATSDVLEVGCGTANHLAAVKRATGAHCVGVDMSERMLAEAATHDVELELRQGRAERLDFAPESFDLVLSVDVVHHIREPAAYFASTFRALRPGGLLCTVTDSEWVIRNRFPMATYFPATVDAELSRYHSVELLTSLATEAGFAEQHEHLVESTYPLTDSERFARKAYSCLHLISDEEFETGLARLRADLERGPLEANLRSCVLWARRPVSGAR